MVMQSLKVKQKEAELGGKLYGRAVALKRFGPCNCSTCRVDSSH